MYIRLRLQMNIYSITTCVYHILKNFRILDKDLKILRLILHLFFFFFGNSVHLKQTAKYFGSRKINQD